MRWTTPMTHIALLLPWAVISGCEPSRTDASGAI